MLELSVQQQQQLSVYLKNNPKVSRAKAIELLFNTQNKSVQNTQKGISVETQNNKKQIITLQSNRKIIISNEVTTYLNTDGNKMLPAEFEKAEGKIKVNKSGRYTIVKNGKTRYYAFDGKELNEKYFKQAENTDVKFKSTNGKTYNITKTVELRLNNLTKQLDKAEKENGPIGSAWSGLKNLTGIGDSSDKVRELQKAEQKLLSQFNMNSKNKEKVFEQLTGNKYSQENLEKFINGEIQLKSEQALNGYKEGQAMSVDIVADIGSGIAAFGIYTAAVAAAPFTGGAFNSHRRWSCSSRRSSNKNRYKSK